MEVSSSKKNIVSKYFDHCHFDWHETLFKALEAVDEGYLAYLMSHDDWFPGREQLFAAFSVPLSSTKYILLGESPYPRKDSANGYAFWDKMVMNLWSTQGLSKAVNRATSLRNMIKMLLLARGDLQTSTSQENIALISKKSLVQTAEELFTGMMKKGILLLNASLVYSENKVPFHARKWKPFMQSVIEQLSFVKPDIQLILFGKIAEMVSQNQLPIGLIAEHPYNVSFITNQKVINFFKPLDLLKYEQP